MTPLYGWYGDDFTGATDTLASIAQRGFGAFLFLGVPKAEHLAALPDIDAIGIAGAARSMTPEAMRQELVPVGRFFQQMGVRLLHYKCCSTFDSGPTVGNLATAIDVLGAFVADPRVAVIGGQPSLGRYCAFTTLFAAAEGTIHRLDRHPTMSVHPVTPMSEADLGRHFCDMGQNRISAINCTDIDQGTLDPSWTRIPAGVVVFDAITATHIKEIGIFLRQSSHRASLLAVGPSSVAEAFFDAPPVAYDYRPSSEPVLAIAGSLSGQTRRQVAAATLYTHIDASPSVIADPSSRSAVVARAASTLGDGGNVLLNTAPRGVEPAAACMAIESSRLIRDILSRVPVKRLAIAGGDTSSRIVMGLGIWGLSFHARSDDGVAICKTRSDDPNRDQMTLLLKGGQMGGEHLFDRFAKSDTELLTYGNHAEEDVSDCGGWSLTLRDS